MNKAKKFLLIVCALLLVAFSAASCKKAGQKDEGFYRSVSAKRALTSSVKISLRGYTFENFLNRGYIKVSEERDGVTYYGVLSGQGDVVLPVSYTLVNMEGDFIVAEGGEDISRQQVFSLDGRQLFVSEEELEVRDVGGGYFSAADRDSSYLYNSKGENVLPGTQLDASYSYSCCGNFVIAKSLTRRSTFIFHVLTSDIIFSFFDSESTNYLVAYMGGSDFAVVKTDVTDSSDYDVALNRGESGVVYYKQTVRRYTAGVPDPVTIQAGRFIVQIANRYSIGRTAEDRENFALKEGYHSVAYYKTEGKAASGELLYYIGDASLKELKTLPDGVSTLLAPVNGLAAATSLSGAIYFLNEKAEVTLTIDDAVYQNVVFTGEVVTASKVNENGVIRLGGFDKEGNEVIPFEYSYISAFVEGKAVASKEGRSYIVTTTGEQTYIGDYTFPYYFDGFYQVNEGGYIGAASYDGISLISPSYQSFNAVRRYGESVYVAISIGSVIDVYRLY